MLSFLSRSEQARQRQLVFDGRMYVVAVESAGESETRLTYLRGAESWTTLGESAARLHTQQIFDTDSFYVDCNT